MKKLADEEMESDLTLKQSINFQKNFLLLFHKYETDMFHFETYIIPLVQMVVLFGYILRWHTICIYVYIK